MKTTNGSGPGRRRNRLLRERVHDPYKNLLKPQDPSRCPQCKAVYHKGRWQWISPHRVEMNEELCQACRRINDRLPAARVTVSGNFVHGHHQEMIALIRHLGENEMADRPLHRIIDIEENGKELFITTTDNHLPRRIGDALKSAYGGDLIYQYEKESADLRVTWRRED